MILKYLNIEVNHLFIKDFINEASMEEMKKSLKTLRDLATCPVCFEELSHDIVSCNNGHVVCHSCRDKLHNCPTCNCEFSAIKLTCLSQMLEALPRICKHSGCNLVMKSVTDHEKWCENRLTNCRVEGCDWDGCVKQLLAHVKENHQNNFGSSHPERRFKNFTNESSRTSTKGYLYHDTFFWRTVTKDQTKEKLTFKLTCVPTKEIKDDFQLKIEFKSKNVSYKAKVTLKIINEAGTLEDNVISFDSEVLQPFINGCGLEYLLIVAKLPRSDGN